jgi:halogenation protein CepH
VLRDYRTRKDYSYTTTRFWRPGLALVGDAACFVDPVFSSGVHLATYGSLLAARSVNSVLEGVLGEEEAFAHFEAKYRREYQIFYDFLIAFYDTSQSTEGYFWHARSLLNTKEAQNDAFVRLVAGAGTTAEDFVAMRRGTGAIFRKFIAASNGAADMPALSAEDEVRMKRVAVAPHVTPRNLVLLGQLGDASAEDVGVMPGEIRASDDGYAWARATSG